MVKLVIGRFLIAALPPGERDANDWSPPLIGGGAKIIPGG